MEITRVGTSARSSRIVTHGHTIYFAGLVGDDPAEDVQGQTRSILTKLEGLLAEAGSSAEHLLSATIYLRDIDQHFADMNEVWNAWVPEGHAPARACVEAHMARPQLLVEISVIAATL